MIIAGTDLNIGVLFHAPRQPFALQDRVPHLVDPAAFKPQAFYKMAFAAHPESFQQAR